MATTNSRPFTSSEIVQRYLGYFRTRAHHEIAGSPLVMPGSGTSFVVAGMQPLLPYLLGRAAPPASRPGGLHQPDQRVASSRHQAPGFHLPQLAVARFARTVPRDDDLLIDTVWMAPVAPVKPPRGPPSIRETACFMRCSSPPGAGEVDLRLLRPIDRQRRVRDRLEVVARSL